jgi:hypothetical protein
LYRHPLVDINNINVHGQRICSHFLVQMQRLLQINCRYFFFLLLICYICILMYNIPTRIFTDLYLKSKRQHFRVFVYKSNLYFFFKKISSNLFVTISAFARAIRTRKCEQILCPGTFILFISTNGCLYNFFYTL